MKKLKTVRAIALILFLAALFCAIDLGLNVLYNVTPQLHDGFSAHSTLHGLFGIFGDSCWSFDLFFAAFEKAAWVAFILLTANIVLFWIADRKRDTTAA